ncbi:SDR family oxidoreductase [Paenibacillus massiliensis]|uniref:SDR family oxidoreductase n=1 Tax=Paenibacillus massiliensis TaxID=225917 RepID=UPI00041A4F98|nr:SDR family oxidoreductase [Paenibacillus massiliensis]
MKILVIGANGQIGQHVVQLLEKDENHSAKAMIRKEEQAPALEQWGAETVIADLEGSVEDIAAAAAGCEAIVFTAGSGGHTGADKTLLIDLDGAVKAMEAAEQAGIQRFILVSAMYADQREKWPEEIKPYYVAKHFADRILMNSNLDYTIIRPGGLVNEEATGGIQIGEDASRRTIPRADVAAIVVAALNEPTTIRRAFDVTSGNMPISLALQRL